MTVGPVQLIVLGFRNPRFQGEIIAELERLRRIKAIRVLDALAVFKDSEGRIEVEHLSSLSTDEAVVVGSKVGALVGLGIDGERWTEVGTTAGEPTTSDDSRLFDDDAWDVLAEVPNDSAVALLLLEHRWAVPLRDAIARAGGFRLDDAFVSPLDLLDIGLLSAEEAQELHDLETSGAAPNG